MKKRKSIYQNLPDLPDAVKRLSSIGAPTFHFSRHRERIRVGERRLAEHDNYKTFVSMCLESIQKTFFVFCFWKIHSILWLTQENQLNWKKCLRKEVRRRQRMFWLHCFPIEIFLFPAWENVKSHGHLGRMHWEQSHADKILAKIAIGVSLFPSDGYSCSWLRTSFHLETLKLRLHSIFSVPNMKIENFPKLKRQKIFTTNKSFLSNNLKSIKRLWHFIAFKTFYKLHKAEEWK